VAKFQFDRTVDSIIPDIADRGILYYNLVIIYNFILYMYMTVNTGLSTIYWEADIYTHNIYAPTQVCKPFMHVTKIRKLTFNLILC
jgi:hypothetical protein